MRRNICDVNENNGIVIESSFILFVLSYTIIVTYARLRMFLLIRIRLNDTGECRGSMRQKCSSFGKGRGDWRIGGGGGYWGRVLEISNLFYFFVSCLKLHFNCNFSPELSINGTIEVSSFCTALWCFYRLCRYCWLILQPRQQKYSRFREW